VTALAVFGPTASGKSGAALELARALGGEIVSCDAMQMYRGLPILTNQPSPDELAAVPHHLVGVWELEHRGSVAEFGELARAAIADIGARGRVPVLCGGSGLYLRAAVAPIDIPPEPENGTRERLEALYEELGPEAAHQLLAQRDPAAAGRVHPNDRRRVVRALELTEQGLSLAPGEDVLWERPDLGGVRIFGLVVDPGEIDRRIAARTEAMLAAGVEQEVRTALAEHRFSETAARMHGLQDVRALLDGEVDRAEAVRRMTLRTRQYAKRQRTWMRRLPGLVEVRGASEILERAA
jgi:tRNA dimethylallyltransferase